MDHLQLEGHALLANLKRLLDSSSVAEIDYQREIHDLRLKLELQSRDNDLRLHHALHEQRAALERYYESILAGHEQAALEEKAAVCAKLQARSEAQLQAAESHAQQLHHELQCQRSRAQVTAQQVQELQKQLEGSASRHQELERKLQEARQAQHMEQEAAARLAAQLHAASTGPATACQATTGMSTPDPEVKGGSIGRAGARISRRSPEALADRYRKKYWRYKHNYYVLRQKCESCLNCVATGIPPPALYVRVEGPAAGASTDSRAYAGEDGAGWGEDMTDGEEREEGVPASPARQTCGAVHAPEHAPAQLLPQGEQQPAKKARMTLDDEDVISAAGVPVAGAGGVHSCAPHAASVPLMAAPAAEIDFCRVQQQPLAAVQPHLMVSLNAAATGAPRKSGAPQPQGRHGVTQPPVQQEQRVPYVNMIPETVMPCYGMYDEEEEEEDGGDGDFLEMHELPPQATGPSKGIIQQTVERSYSPQGGLPASGPPQQQQLAQQPTAGCQRQPDEHRPQPTGIARHAEGAPLQPDWSHVYQAPAAPAHGAQDTMPGPTSTAAGFQQPRCAGALGRLGQALSFEEQLMREAGLDSQGATQGEREEDGAAGIGRGGASVHRSSLQRQQPQLQQHHNQEQRQPSRQGAASGSVHQLVEVVEIDTSPEARPRVVARAATTAGMSVTLVGAALAGALPIGGSLARLSNGSDMQQAPVSSVAAPDDVDQVEDEEEEDLTQPSPNTLALRKAAHERDKRRAGVSHPNPAAILEEAAAVRSGAAGLHAPAAAVPVCESMPQKATSHPLQANSKRPAAGAKTDARRLQGGANGKWHTAQRAGPMWDYVKPGAGVSDTGPRQQQQQQQAPRPPSDFSPLANSKQAHAMAAPTGMPAPKHHTPAAAPQQRTNTLPVQLPQRSSVAPAPVTDSSAVQGGGMDVTAAIQQPAGMQSAEVVRKRGERAELPGYACYECQRFFEAMASWGKPTGAMPVCGHQPPAAAAAQAQDAYVQEASRHRARYQPPSTPQGFWDLGFPNSPP